MHSHRKKYQEKAYIGTKVRTCVLRPSIRALSHGFVTSEIAQGPQGGLQSSLFNKSLSKHTYRRRLSLAANLEENEKIKAELAPTKINEPKTPFHAPYSEEDELDLGEVSHEGKEATTVRLHTGPAQQPASCSHHLTGRMLFSCQKV